MLLHVKVDEARILQSDGAGAVLLKPSTDEEETGPGRIPLSLKLAGLRMGGRPKRRVDSQGALAP